MYAVFKTGGKQYRATTGDVIKVEKIEAEKGATVELDQVLMVGEGEDVKVGAPYLDGGKVTATVVWIFLKTSGLLEHCRMGSRLIWMYTMPLR